jgi:hypothetical protein
VKLCGPDHAYKVWPEGPEERWIVWPGTYGPVFDAVAAGVALTVTAIGSGVEEHPAVVVPTI